VKHDIHDITAALNEVYADYGCNSDKKFQYARAKAKRSFIAFSTISAILLTLAAEHVNAGQSIQLDSYVRDADLSVRSGETSLAYSGRMADLVHRQSAYCVPSHTGFSLIEKVGSVIAPTQLFVHGVLVRENFKCGSCAAKAQVLKTILAEKGIESSLYFTQHVILKSGDTYLDPSFGLGPFKLTDYKQVYRNVPILAPGVSWNYVFQNPSGDDQMQGRWGAVVEIEESIQRVFFKIADAIAAVLALAGFFLAFRSWRLVQTYPSRTALTRSSSTMLSIPDDRFLDRTRAPRSRVEFDWKHVICKLSGHLRSKKLARRRGHQWLSSCVLCGDSMIRLGPGRWVLGSHEYQPNLTANRSRIYSPSAAQAVG
jgi:hypothetical protein